MPRSLSELGICRDEFEAALPDLADAAFADASLRTNPRMPLVSELHRAARSGLERAGMAANYGSARGMRTDGAARRRRTVLS